MLVIRVNTGLLQDTWLTDPDVGGGPLVGEGCHFLDLASHLVGKEPLSVTAAGIPSQTRGAIASASFSLRVDYADGSVASIVYSGLGDTRMSKERIEMMRGGRAGVIDDFRRWEVFANNKRVVSEKRRTSDKGHRAEAVAFADLCAGRSNREDHFATDIQTMLLTFAAAEALEQGRTVEVPTVSLSS